MQKIKKGDNVEVLVGKDKGKQGIVNKIVLKRDRTGMIQKHAVVSGVNIKKKHQRGNPQAGVAGGIISKEAAISISNIALVNPNTKKADKVATKVLADGKKVRCFRSSGELVDA